MSTSKFETSSIIVQNARSLEREKRMKTNEDGNRDVGSDLNLDQLEKMAEESDSGEIYQLVSEGIGFRVGVIVATEADGSKKCTVELLLQALFGTSDLDVSALEKALFVYRQIEKRGYRIVHLDDGWICGTKTVPASQVTLECKAAVDAILTLNPSRSARFIRRTDGSE